MNYSDFYAVVMTYIYAIDFFYSKNAKRYANASFKKQKQKNKLKYIMNIDVANKKKKDIYLTKSFPLTNCLNFLDKLRQ